MKLRVYCESAATAAAEQHTMCVCDGVKFNYTCVFVVRSKFLILSHILSTHLGKINFYLLCCRKCGFATNFKLEQGHTSSFNPIVPIHTQHFTKVIAEMENFRQTHTSRKLIESILVTERTHLKFFTVAMLV